MTEARVLTRPVLVRAGLRGLVAAGLVALFAWKAGGLIVIAAAGYAGAVAAATAFVERVAALRCARRGLPELRGGLETMLACALLHAAALVNAALWLEGSGPDLGARLGRLATWLDRTSVSSGPGPVFGLACAAWLLAGPSGTAAVLELRRLQGRPATLSAPPARPEERLPATLELWSLAFALWVAPVMTLHMRGVGPSLGDRVVPFGAVLFVTGMGCLMAGAVGVLVLRGLDGLAERADRRWSNAP